MEYDPYVYAVSNVEYEMAEDLHSTVVVVSEGS